jgi:hypothetical protein
MVAGRVYQIRYSKQYTDKAAADPDIGPAEFA